MEGRREREGGREGEREINSRYRYICRDINGAKDLWCSSVARLLSICMKECESPSSTLYTVDRDIFAGKIFHL